MSIHETSWIGTSSMNGSAHVNQFAHNLVLSRTWEAMLFHLTSKRQEFSFGQETWTDRLHDSMKEFKFFVSEINKIVGAKDHDIIIQLSCK